MTTPLGRPVQWLVGLALVALWGLPASAGRVQPAGHEAAFAAAASGPAATGWNPAHLALFPERRLELFSLAARAGNDSYALDEYAQWNGAEWDDQDKQAILGAVEGDALTMAGRASLRAAGLAWGSLAISTETRAASRAALPRPALELLLYGNTVGESFDLSGASGVGAAFSEVRLSWALPLARLSLASTGRLADWCVGASAKLLSGWGYAELIEAHGGVTTTVESLSGDGSLKSVTARGGRGFGFDLGLAGPLGSDWTASLAARDLCASIEWTDHVEQRTDTFEAPGMSLGDGEEIVVTESVVVPLRSVETVLPPIYAAGVARHGERLLLALHLEAAGERRLGMSSALRLSSGAAWTLRRWLALRGSLSLGGEDAAAIGGGAGVALGPAQLDLGLSSWGSLNPFSSKGLGLAISLGMAL